jgi:predicted esterase
MSDLTMKQFEQEFYRLYSEGAYVQAYDLATQEAGRFPEWAQSSYYNWRMCAACLMGEPRLALRLFEQALAAGFWYDQAGLREDPDLATLQGLPEFERLVAFSLQQRDQALARAKPALEIFEPQTHIQPYPLLLALHGNNSNLEESARYWRTATTSGWLVAAPQSAQVMGNGTYGWNDRDWAVREIEQHLATIREQYPIDPARIVVAGFSMGGGLAAWLALSGNLQVRGFIGVGLFLAQVESVLPLLEAPRERALRAYLVASQRDAYCYSVAQKLADLLPPHGIACELELHPDLGHDFPPAFEHSLIKGLDFITNEAYHHTGEPNAKP